MLTGPGGIAGQGEIVADKAEAGGDAAVVASKVAGEEGAGKIPAGTGHRRRNIRPPVAGRCGELDPERALLAPCPDGEQSGRGHSLEASGKPPGKTAPCPNRA